MYLVYSTGRTLLNNDLVQTVNNIKIVKRLICLPEANIVCIALYILL